MAKKIIFSKHALDQLKIRKIPKRQVLQTIKNSGSKLKSFRDRELRHRVFNGKILEVVIYESGDAIDVITQYFLEEGTDAN